MKMYNQLYAFSKGITGLPRLDPGLLGLVAGDMGFYSLEGSTLRPLGSYPVITYGLTGGLLVPKAKSLSSSVGSPEGSVLYVYPDTYVKLMGLSTAAIISLVTPDETSYVHEYCLRFSLSSGGSIRFPSGLRWSSSAGGASVALLKYYTAYEVSIVDGYAILVELGGV